MKIPTISILGKPNVGKSTLFNRLVGKKQSIVSSVAGVTRDRVYGKFEWLNKEYHLIDTGGYIHDSTDTIDKQVNFQAAIAKNTSDVIIFMVDGSESLSSNDLTLSKIIKKSGKPCILVLNKIDSISSEVNSYEFYELGFEDLICTSAQNGRQIGLLLDKIDELDLHRDILNVENEDIINLAIVGMPNVGKSSLMNSIIKEDKSIVTSVAGTTRDSVDSYINYFNKSLRIIDTAGLRKKSKMDDAIEFYSSLRSVRAIDESDVVALLIDAKKGITNYDKNIIKYIFSKGKGMLIVINKWDLIDKETNTMQNIKDDITYKFPVLNHYPIIFISIKNNFRIGNVLKNTLEIYKNRLMKISTKKLNEFLKKIISKKSPPAVNGKEIKIKYITQVHQAPPVFAIFTNFPDLIEESYKRYILNQILKEFGFYGVSVKISIRPNK
tara:strand:+ start:3171 stop:4487 length:1317 start_codon:yes stop_codon:yes gene_type:complete